MNAELRHGVTQYRKNNWIQMCCIVGFVGVATIGWILTNPSMQRHRIAAKRQRLERELASSCQTLNAARSELAVVMNEAMDLMKRRNANDSNSEGTPQPCTVDQFTKCGQRLLLAMTAYLHTVDREYPNADRLWVQSVGLNAQRQRLRLKNPYDLRGPTSIHRQRLNMLTDGPVNEQHVRFVLEADMDRLDRAVVQLMKTQLSNGDASEDAETAIRDFSDSLTSIVTRSQFHRTW